MKTISAALEAHLAQEVTTLCTCWKIVRQDGQVFGFTDHDQDLVFNGLTYESETGYNRTAIHSDSSLSVDNLDVTGFLESDRISENDLRNGLFDHANVYIFALNWADTAQGEIKLRRGWFGEVTLNQNGSFETEIRGLHQALSHNFMETYQPECRADFCDTRCKLIYANYVRNCIVGTLTSRSQFTAVVGTYDPVEGTVDGTLPPAPEIGAETYIGGTIKFTSGPNTGKTIEIIDYDEATGEVTVLEDFPYEVSVGDELELAQGCDKRFTTCKLYNNQDNFRGEPHVPGQDEYLKYPDAHS